MFPGQAMSRVVMPQMGRCDGKTRHPLRLCQVLPAFWLGRTLQSLVAERNTDKVNADCHRHRL